MPAFKEPDHSVDFQLTGIDRTLLMLLWGRAKATRANSRILFDAKAVEIVERLGLNLEDFERVLHPSNELFTIARARTMDDLVRGFVADHPKATVINLGAGLDTGFFRIDNGLLQWFDVDLPQVIELRRKLIPVMQRSRYVSASLLEPDWVNDITPRSSDLFFLASGVMVSLRKEELRRLFSVLVDSFPGAELAFDVQSRLTNFFGNRRLKAAGMGVTRFQWGACSAKPIRRLNHGIEVVEEFGIFSKVSGSDYADRKSWRMARMMDRMHTMTIIHVRFTHGGTGHATY
jgi:O-methyltransferase involved in polyketide biosynthesis